MWVLGIRMCTPLLRLVSLSGAIKLPGQYNRHLPRVQTAQFMSAAGHSTLVTLTRATVTCTPSIHPVPSSGVSKQRVW